MLMAIQPVEDPVTGIEDIKGLNEARKEFMDLLDKDDRISLEAYQQSKKTPAQKRYDAARNAMASYMESPRYVGLSKDEGELVYKAGQALSDVQRSLPMGTPGPQEVALSRLQAQDPKLAERARTYLKVRYQPNPQRLAIWRQNESKLSTYYGDQAPSESTAAAVAATKGEASSATIPEIEKEKPKLDAIINGIPAYSPDVIEGFRVYNEMPSSTKYADFTKSYGALYAKMQKEKKAREDYIAKNKVAKEYIAYIKRTYSVTDEDIISQDISSIDGVAGGDTGQNFITYLWSRNQTLEGLQKISPTMAEKALALGASSGLEEAEAKARAEGYTGGKASTGGGYIKTTTAKPTIKTGATVSVKKGQKLSNADLWAKAAKIKGVSVETMMASPRKAGMSKAELLKRAAEIKGGLSVPAVSGTGSISRNQLVEWLGEITQGSPFVHGEADKWTRDEIIRMIKQGLTKNGHNNISPIMMKALADYILKYESQRKTVA
jgi:hypothetical protein